MQETRRYVREVDRRFGQVVGHRENGRIDSLFLQRTAELIGGRGGKQFHKSVHGKVRRWQ